MRRRHLGFALSLLGGALTQLGCQSLSPAPAQSYAPPTTFEKPLDSPRSSEEAALTCLRAAEAYDKNGREADAIQGYEMARQQNPKLTQVSRRLAVLYDRQGEMDKAAGEYAKALKVNPKDSDLLNDYGYFLYEQEKYLDAEATLRRALQINPKNRRANVNLGLAVGQQRRYGDAFLIFTGAVGEAEAHANLGYIYTTQGRREEATNAYREAFALNPNLKQAQVALEVLAKPEGFKETSNPYRAEPIDPRSRLPRAAAATPPVTRERNPEEIVQRLSNFRKEHGKAEAIQATKRPEAVDPAETPSPVEAPKFAEPPRLPETPKSSLYDPAAERESFTPTPPKRFIPSVKPITIPTPGSSGNSQE